MEYKGITFREGYTSFPEFKKELENVWVFKQMYPDQKEKELKKAYKIATGKSADELPTSKRKSGKSKSVKGKQSPVSGNKKD